MTKKITIVFMLAAITITCSRQPAVSPTGPQLTVVFQGAMLFYSAKWNSGDPVWVLLPNDVDDHIARIVVPHASIEAGLKMGGRLPTHDDGLTAEFVLKGERLSLCKGGTNCTALGGNLVKTPSSVSEDVPCENTTCNDMAFRARRAPITWIAEVPQQYPLLDECLKETTALLAAQFKFSDGTFETQRLEGQHYPDENPAQFKRYNLPVGTGNAKALGNAVAAKWALPAEGVDIRSISLIDGSSQKPIILRAAPGGGSISLGVLHLPKGPVEKECEDDNADSALHFRLIYKKLLDLKGDDYCNPPIPSLSSGAGGDEACPPGRK